ncbi:transport and Golgi organization protein 1 homolog [Camelus bactrianus]|uniref:Transport and Golgi organization protein 1 homolog n=1 Tax=Camelus bactrianus TaxID=9837 RepID=A0AC58PEE1_CAMBA
MGCDLDVKGAIHGSGDLMEVIQPEDDAFCAGFTDSADRVGLCVTKNAVKCLEDTIRQKKMLSEEALKFKENLKTIERVNEHLNDVQIARAKLQAVRDQNTKSPHLPGVSKTRSEGAMQRAVTTGDCSLEEGKKKMQDHHAASGSPKEREEDGFQRQVKKVRVLDEISGQRSMDTEGKVDMNGCGLVGKQQLLAAKEKAELAEEERRWYKIRLEECHGQMREAEITWRHQVTLAEKKAQDSSLRSQELEREISELRRENSDLRRENSDLRTENSSELRREVAHLKQRLDATCRRRQAEEYMRQEPTPGRPYRLHPPLRASGPGDDPVRNGTAFPAQEAEETQNLVQLRCSLVAPAPLGDHTGPDNLGDRD